MNQSKNYSPKCLLSLAGFFFLFIIFSCNDNKSTSDTTATNNDTTLNDDCKIVFPTLQIDSSDFAEYYKKQGFFPSSKHFRKLVFQFQLERYPAVPDTMRLICYALNRDRGTMHADTIPVRTLHPISVQSFDGLLNLGNLELPKDTLEKLIGKHNNIKPFSFLSLKPGMDPNHPHYIYYEILVDNKIPFTEIVTNPCPPGSQD